MFTADTWPVRMSYFAFVGSSKYSSGYLDRNGSFASGTTNHEKMLKIYWKIIQEIQ